MVTSPGFWGTKGSVWLESVLWRRISIGAVVSRQLSAVSSLLGRQNKRRLYLRVGGKQTGRGSVVGQFPITDYIGVKPLTGDYGRLIEVFVGFSASLRTHKSHGSPGERSCSFTGASAYQ